MTRSLLPPLLLAAALLAASACVVDGTGDDEDPTPTPISGVYSAIAGSWSGSASVSITTFDVSITIEPDAEVGEPAGTYTFEGYTTNEDKVCAGSLLRVSESDDVYVFQEELESARGGICDVGEVELTYNDIADTIDFQETIEGLSLPVLGSLTRD